MESRNPVFNNSKAFSQKGYATFNEAPPATAGQLEDMYAAPSATAVDTGRMTIDDVVIKTGLMFAVLLPLAAAAYCLNNPSSPSAAPSPAWSSAWWCRSSSRRTRR